eukprot:9393364-Pyramimonas_sp.AAC.1
MPPVAFCLRTPEAPAALGSSPDDLRQVRAMEVQGGLDTFTVVGTQFDLVALCGAQGMPELRGAAAVGRPRSRLAQTARVGPRRFRHGPGCVLLGVPRKALLQHQEA